MSFTQRNRRVAFDNISSGNAAGPERLIAGDTVSVIETFGGGTRTSTSTGEQNHTNTVIGEVVSDGVGPDNNNVGNAAGDENVAIGG